MKRWLRRLGAMWVVALIIWLPIEDTQVWLSILLALGACAWFLSYRVELRKKIGDDKSDSEDVSENEDDH